VDADLALRRACDRFSRRFRFLEEQLGARLGETSLEEMDRVWEQGKRAGL
jgi:uncharacterized protein YabN with tetrapyrrole methylase and pyrophosphatase domain